MIDSCESILEQRLGTPHTPPVFVMTEDNSKAGQCSFPTIELTV